MMRKIFSLLLLAALLTLPLAGCGKQPGGDAVSNVPEVSSNLTSAAVPAESAGSKPAAPPNSAVPDSPSGDPGPELDLKKAAREAVEYLRDRDLEGLTTIIDPEKGLRFSPYAHIDAKSSLVFQAGQLPDFKDTQKLNWGTYDGSGQPIQLTFRDYFEKFVYNQDFSSAPDVSVNKLKGTGNVPFNGKDIYPDASFVEFHFAGFDKKNEGTDWESLILVMRKSGQQWKLSALVHAGRTN